MRMFLGSGGRFIEREGVSTLSIRGYPRALRYLLLCFQKWFAFQVYVGFEKVSFEKFLGNSCICPQECMKYSFKKLFESVGAKSVLFLKEQVPRRNLPTLRN